MKKLETQEEILSQAGSGYGREQLVRLALQLACRQLQHTFSEYSADDMATAYLRMAWIELGGEVEEEEEEGEGEADA